MGWRTVVITKTSKLDYSLGYMVVRDVERTVKIHISEISFLVVGSTSVSLTAYLLNELKMQWCRCLECCKNTLGSSCLFALIWACILLWKKSVNCLQWHRLPI